MSQPNVLHLCPLWFPIGRDAPGGIETFLARLTAELAGLGCGVTMLAADGSTAPPGVHLVPATDLGLTDLMFVGRATEHAYYEHDHRCWTYPDVSCSIFPPERVDVARLNHSTRKWGQCGGNGWAGPTTCEAGSTCVKNGDWYSQCV